VHVLGLAAELGQFGPESLHTSRMICSIGSRCRAGEYRVPVLGDENQVDVHDETQCRKYRACQY
jgi:hypothetical protein